ncbi:hypothetical protein V6U90_07495 [Micromonospora sp. CPCC 206060]|uniref:LolA family protein n=1 Tax=Micromonospora sp. CPCC 206060 TaxID=3122406 RepID=UPI002FF37900
MSIITRPTLRWLVPVTAVAAVIGGGAAIGTFAAEAEPSLPPRTAAQLLVDLQTSRLEGLSGTVVQRADLGLPALAGLASAAAGDLTALVDGTNTLRVWYSGPDRQRVALIGTLGESDLIRDGRDVWAWNSRTNEAVHHTVAAENGTKAAPSDLPATPQQAADLALAAIDPSTEVSVGRSATVAGRDAYELVLDPRDNRSLIAQIRIAIDATEHIPLRFEVFATGADRAAFEVAFTQVDFRRPDAAQFKFNPPPGVKIVEGSAKGDAPERKPGTAPDGMDRTKTVGTGWTTVVVAEAGPLGEADKAAGNKADGDKAAGDKAAAEQIAGLLNGLTKVSGDWGSGRLLTSRLFSVLLTDDGRVLVGAVTPERLYEVARG